jgi:hypothetical protein
MQPEFILSTTKRTPEKNTIESYSATLSKFRDQLGNSRELNGISSEEILSFLNKITDGGKQQAKHGRCSHLKAFFNFMKNNFDTTLQNPCDTPMLGKLYRPGKPNHWSIVEKETIDEIIFRTIKSRNRLLLELMARGGMRVGEVLKLTPENVIDQNFFDLPSGASQEYKYKCKGRGSLLGMPDFVQPNSMSLYQFFPSTSPIIFWCLKFINETLFFSSPFVHLMRSCELRKTVEPGKNAIKYEGTHMDTFIQARLDLIEYALVHTLDEFLSRALDKIGALVDSPIGFYHFVESDQKTLSLQQWSTRTLNEFCKAEGKSMHYSIDEAGVWVDCVRERKPVIHNDYPCLKHKKGMPEGMRR